MRQGDASNSVPVLPRLRAVPALSRGIAILRLLAQATAPMGVHAIARELELVPSTCLHMLRVLTEEQLLLFDPRARKYVVGPGLAALARTALNGNSFAIVTQPDLQELSARYGATVLAVEASGLEHMTVMALSRALLPLQIHTEIGSRFPALISATGRCVAAFSGAPWSELQRRFKALRWDAPPSLDRWRAEVAKTRENGYAVDDGQYIRGLLIVAAPVLAMDGIIRALVVVGLRERLMEAGSTIVGEDLSARSRALTAALGGTAFQGCG